MSGKFQNIVKSPLKYIILLLQSLNQHVKYKHGFRFDLGKTEINKTSYRMYSTYCRVKTEALLLTKFTLN